MRAARMHDVCCNQSNNSQYASNSLEPKGKSPDFSVQSVLFAIFCANCKRPSEQVDEEKDVEQQY
jgi:hypothetical protein